MLATTNPHQKDIADLVATLSGRQNPTDQQRNLRGPERAAILMLALGEQFGGKIWKMLDDDELRQLSVTSRSSHD